MCGLLLMIFIQYYVCLIYSDKYLLNFVNNYTIIDGNWHNINNELLTGNGYGWIGDKIPESLLWNKYIINAYITLTILGCQSGISFHINKEYSNEIYFGMSSEYIVIHDFGVSMIHKEYKILNLYETIKLTVIVDVNLYKLYINDTFWRALPANYAYGSIGLRSNGTCDDSYTKYSNISVNVYGSKRQPAINTTITYPMQTQNTIITTKSSDKRSLFGLPVWIFEVILVLIIIILLMECVCISLAIYYCVIKAKLRHMENEKDHITAINHNRVPSKDIVFFNDVNSDDVKSDQTSFKIVYGNTPSNEIHCDGIRHTISDIMPISMNDDNMTIDDDNISTDDDSIISDDDRKSNSHFKIQEISRNNISIDNTKTRDNTVTVNASKNATAGVTESEEIILMTRTQYCQL